MLESDQKFGFIIIDGSGVLFATVCGRQQTILSRWGVTLPKKHGRGGQSALRFSRLRNEARANYVTKAKEMAVNHFIDPSTSRCNVAGIVLAGSADFKEVLKQALDPRLNVLALFDIQYGFNQGLQQAVTMADGTLKNVGLLQEKKIISQFFEEIARSDDNAKISYGMRDTLPLIDSGVIETLIVWENLPDIRSVVQSPDGVTRTFVCKEEDIPKHVEKGDEILESDLFVDWITENYHNFGMALVIVGDATPEGSQFCRGFGGVGAVLRYNIASEIVEPQEDEVEEGKEEDEDDESEYWF
eukprot:TRINITY_DN5921_c0_g1_i1.p1 TRINITY_DN5921_c0_g1~~TRINITY_DN5921_c0_g1_i1.p1  ORF type:complete len:300 (+),score=101.03 TRINITY_DN5921_c0_g1_i1:451-1350(+)